MNSDPFFSVLKDESRFSGTSPIALAETEREIGHGVQQDATLLHALSHGTAAELSAWSHSGAKRLFDLACVIGALPISLPLLLVIGLAVRLTSRGPVLFLQERTGRNGKKFTIYKFRTMPVHDGILDRAAVTTNQNQRFTSIGSFLRRSKLDELPQLLNVLRGDMSLVGPRPKVLHHEPGYLHYRPGITGFATLVFAGEEAVLARIPFEDLDVYYHSVVLPMKRRLDDEYMAKATFASDLKLIVRSVLRNWSDDELVAMLFSSTHAAPAHFTAGGWLERSSPPTVFTARPTAMNAQRQEE